MVGLLGAIGYAAPGFMEGREWADKQRLTQADLEGVEALGQAFKNWGLGGGGPPGTPGYYGGTTPYPGQASEPMYRPRADIPGAGVPGWQAGLGMGGGQDASLGEGMARWGVGGPMSTPAGMPTRTGAAPGVPAAPELNLTGGGRWLPGAGGPGSGPDARLAFERQAAIAQVMNDPAALERIYRTVSAEDPRGLIPQLEEIFNRGAARGQDPRTAASDPNFYPQRTQQYRGGDVPREQFMAGLQQIARGSNETQFATDNASADVGLGWGQRRADPYTYRSPSGERYGPARRDMPWVLERTGGAMPRAAEGSAPYPGQMPGGAGQGGGGGEGDYRREERRISTDPRSGLPQMDVPTLAQRISRANPNISGAAMWAALNRAVPLLNADGKLQLAEMRSMDANRRLEYLYSDSARKYSQFEQGQIEKNARQARDLELKRSLAEDKAALQERLKDKDITEAQRKQFQANINAIDRLSAQHGFRTEEIGQQQTGAMERLTKTQEFKSKYPEGMTVKGELMRMFKQQNPNITPDELAEKMKVLEHPSVYQLRQGELGHQIDVVNGLIDQSIGDIQDSFRPGGQPIPTGFAGTIAQWMERAGNAANWTDANAANMFKQRIQMLQLMAPRLLSSGDLRSNAQQRELIKEIVGALEPTSTRPISLGQLQQLSDTLKQLRPLQTSRTGMPGEGPRPSLSREEQFRQQAASEKNPDGSRKYSDEQINEFLKRLK